MKLDKQKTILITLFIILFNAILPSWKYRGFNREMFEMDYIVYIFPSILVVILFSLGLFYYYRDSNRHRLLKFLFQATFNYYLFYFICNLIIANRVLSAGYFNSMINIYISYFFLNHFIPVVIVFLSYLVLKFLYKTDKPHIEIYQTGDVITRSLIAASQTKRFGNYFIDTLFYLFLIGRLAIEFQNFESSGLESIALVMILFIYFFYHVINEAIFQTTLGKVINKCLVTDANGDPIGWSDAAVRTIVRFIPFERFSILFGGIPWHDKISNTEVLDLDEYQECE
jgi:uncharacterized RDD family membrane protein YckC